MGSMFMSRMIGGAIKDRHQANVFANNEFEGLRSVVFSESA